MISFNKYPIDIILCVLWSVILLPIGLLDIGDITRIILGLPFILFLPGYVLIFALFPSRKTDRGIDIIERIALSFGFSIAVVSLIGFGLNYTPWGIRVESILLSIFVFVISIGAVAIYRWFRTAPEERFIIALNLSAITSKGKLDKALNIVIVISIILSVAISVYVLVTPKQRDKFTEFYILGPSGNTTDYPKKLSIGNNYSVHLVVGNHEYKTVNYTIEIWLINLSEDKIESIIHNMWFVDKILTTLKHTDIEIRKTKTPQWEYNYSFSINRTGSFKLTFLLFTTPSEEYNKDVDYRDIMEQKISTAYRETHLWIEVN